VAKGFMWGDGSSKPLMQFKYSDIPSKDVENIKKEYSDKKQKVPDSQQILYIFMQKKLNIERGGN
jgi:hypothetical protein